MNSTFLTEHFWQPYLTLEPDDLSDDEINAQLDGLREDFIVREDIVTFEYEGKEQTATHRVVEFPFFCGERFSLVLEYEPDAFGCEKNLYLIDARSGTKSQMGWWDLARWHPYCLRLCELDTLLQFWQRRDQQWSGSEIPLLLLSQFVGLCNAADLNSLTERAEAAYRSLGLPVVVNDKPAVPLHIKKDYRWEIDHELGWVFTSDEYCCYSIRNRPHSESTSETFPFHLFREMMLWVEEQL